MPGRFDIARRVRKPHFKIISFRVELNFHFVGHAPVQTVTLHYAGTSSTRAA